MIKLDLQNPYDFETIPAEPFVQQWVDAAIQNKVDDYSVVIRFVDEDEGLQLNQSYRQKNKATNVLSFPYEMPEIPELREALIHLGDLVLCEPVVRREALAQGKPLSQHWAHLIVHGMLHLQGYDHITDAQAEMMEALEIRILKSFGFNNPYITL